MALLLTLVTPAAAADIVVKATAPTFSDTDGSVNDYYDVPTLTGVEYLVDGQVVDDRTSHRASGTVLITARAKPGYVLSSLSDSSWSYIFNPATRDVSVTAKAPKFVDSDGSRGDYYFIEDTTGVEYLVDGQVVATRTSHYVSGTVLITARAKPGYVLNSLSDSSWSYIFNPATRDVSVTAKAPTFSDTDGSSGDYYYVPTIAGVEYLVDGQVVDDRTSHRASGTVLITARAKPGYVLSSLSDSSWSHIFITTARDATATMVVPEEPAFVDHDGADRDIYIIRAKEGVEYLVDGEVKAAGSYPASGTVLITSRAKPGYYLAGTTSWSRIFSTNIPTILVVPEEPAFVDHDGADRDIYIIRAKEGVEYLVDGEVKAAGSYPASGTVLITSRAKPGYALGTVTATSWSRIFSTAVPKIMAVPEAPAFSDMDGTDRDIYIIRAKEGVEYLVDGEVKVAGSYPASGTVLITSRAKPGYYLAGTTSWSRIFSTAVLAIHVTPAAPVFADQYGTANDTYTLPASYGVEYYYVNGVATAAGGTYKGSGTVTVTAKARTGYTLVGTTTWSHTFTTDAVIWVLPQAVYFDDEDGTANDTYTVPAKTGVEYTVGGAVKPAGTYPARGTVTVIAQAKPGYGLSGTVRIFSHAFKTTPHQVAPAAVSFTDEDGTAKDTYTIPATEGVDYLVNGQVKAAGTYPGAGTVEVTARAKTDYVLEVGVATSWKTTFKTTPHQVAPAAVSFTDEDGTAKDTYTIPATEGVDYLVNGQVKAAGTYPGAGTVEVTARAKTDYVLAEGAASSWSQTFDTTATVSAAVPVFTDKSGTAYDTYTVPAKTGVQYYVNGVAKAAGTYKGTGTITVTAKAKTGYTLTGTSSWQKTFAKTIVVTPTAATFADKSGTAYDTYTVPAKTGVQYYVNGVAKAAGTYKGTGTITVTAKAKTGYALTGTSSWQKTFAKTIVVTATAATFSDKSGTTYDRYIIPAKTGVQYYVNGVAKAAGTYKGTGTITVTAKAKTGYTLTGTSTWKRTFGR
ncbi:InlB B-repeat-containing protein [Kocuria arenosa]|uniref:InlB B-repeat-containing protein n=1 Tax=Kocuria arenosa TaxID=3071446 RepID=UPI0034D6135F